MAYMRTDIPLEELNRSWLPALERSHGMRMTKLENDQLTAELVVSEALLQPFGIMHGGISCVIGESMGSVAGSLCLADANKTVVGQSLHALYMRPAKLGTRIQAVASAQHIGNRSQIWDISLSDKDSGKAIARITLSLAIIDKPR